MLHCQSCGATYEPTQPDGAQYFHACPPLSRAELAAAVKDGRVVLPKKPGGKTETVDEAMAARVYERANKRDENIVSTKAANDGAILAEGAGAVELDTPTPARVVTVPQA